MALAFYAREYDRRFFDRGVVADVRVLQDVRIDRDALSPKGRLREKKDLLESLEHLGEIGSLLRPTPDDIAALEAELSNASGGLLATKTRTDLQYALDTCKALARNFDVAVANPPYMGSGKFNAYFSKWMKKHYPDSCKDLCTAFIERGYSLVCDQGYGAMVTMQSWMFLSSFEKMRKKIIDGKTIVTMAHLGPRAFDAIGGEVVSVTADVLLNGRAQMRGSYVRLVDVVGEVQKREKYLEAIHNPDCGWFYRSDASTFHDIPGSPIAYWASEAIHSAFLNNQKLSQIARPRQGVATGNNDLFIRNWWESALDSIGFGIKSRSDASSGGKKWFPCNKGGNYRKWYGNHEYIVNWEDDGREIRRFTKNGRLASRPQNMDFYFREGMTWGTISSDKISMRFSPEGFIPETKGSMCFAEPGDSIIAYIGIANSSVEEVLLVTLAPTLDFHEGPLGRTPIPVHIIKDHQREIECLVSVCIDQSKLDWDSQETSWDFRRNPLV